MGTKAIIDVIIPAFNEENSVGNVVNDIPKGLVREIIVVNNNSTDKTAINAINAGATVLEETTMGYGNACLKGMFHISQKEIKPDIVVFLDADYSDYPEEIVDVIQPAFQHCRVLLVIPIHRIMPFNVSVRLGDGR